MVAAASASGILMCRLTQARCITIGYIVVVGGGGVRGEEGAGGRDRRKEMCFNG
jgi:hypothetical protein